MCARVTNFGDNVRMSGIYTSRWRRFRPEADNRFVRSSSGTVQLGQCFA